MLYPFSYLGFIQCNQSWITGKGIAGGIVLVEISLWFVIAISDLLSA